MCDDSIAYLTFERGQWWWIEQTPTKVRVFNGPFASAREAENAMCDAVEEAILAAKEP